VGDRVLTHTGSWKQVTVVLPTDHPADIVYSLRTYGNSIPLVITGNHRVPSLVDGVLEDRRVDELIEKEAWVGTPVVPNNRASYKELRLSKYITDCNKLYEEERIYLLQNHNSDSTGGSYRKTSSESIPTAIWVNNQLGRFLGLYLAEGNIFTCEGDPYGIEFAFNTNETHLIEEVVNYSKDILGITPIIKGKICEGVLTNCTTVRIFNKLIGIIFNNLFGRDKVIPEWLWHVDSGNFYRGLVSGMIDGDGHIDDRGKSMGTYLVAKNINHLIFIRNITLRYGIAPALYIKSNGEYSSYVLLWSGDECLKLESWCSIQKTKGRRYIISTNPTGNCYISDNTLWCKVRSIDRVEYDGPLYDITVEDDATYTTATCTIHNSRSPWEGSRISYFRPNYFARLKSQYQYTPSLYGSKMEEFLFRNPLMKPFTLLADPYHWERKSYFSAPTPETGPEFEEVPFIGSLLASTVGRVVKPIKTMHGDELRASFNGPAYAGPSSGAGPGFFPPAGLGAAVNNPFQPSALGGYSMELRHPAPISQHGIQQTLARTFYRAGIEAPGLYGWELQSLLGGEPPGSAATIMDNSNYRTSYTRAYWDMQIGGALGMSEYGRRFLPREFNRNAEIWNPLQANTPDWLPGPDSGYYINFKNPAALARIPESDLRLPSWGNMAAYHTSLAMPFRASQLGKSREEMVQYLTGTRPPNTAYAEDVMEAGTAMHKIITEELQRANLLVKAEAPVYDPVSDISGTVDAIVRQGKRTMALEFKTVSTDKLESLAAPINQHRSQINFYLKQLRLRQGSIVYISREDPNLTKTFNVTFDYGKYLHDVAALGEARGNAREILYQGLGEPGQAYSHLDRLRVVSDLAPFSQSYKDELGIVNQQDKAGMLSPEEHEEKLKILKRRNSTTRTYDFYPRRFDIKGIVSPDPEYQLMNENENIKAAAEYPLPARIIGSAWEYLTHQRTPLHTKLIGSYSPREQFERQVVYGREAAFWNEPWRDFVEPYMRAAVATRRPDEGIIRGLQAGFLLGGPAGAAVGAGALGVYGTLHGTFRWLTGTTFVPGNVKRKWEVADYFDKLEYLKAKRLYEITGMGDYAKAMGETMAGINPMRLGRGSMTDVARAVPSDIKPYIFSFMAEKDPRERERIAAEVPENVANVLRVKWALADKDSALATRVNDDMRQANDLTSYFKNHNLPAESNLLWNPNVPLEDVQLKTVEHEGFSAHDFSMGFSQQVRRIKYSPSTPGPIDISNPTGEPVDSYVDTRAVTDTIKSVLGQYGVGNIRVSAVSTPGMGSRVTINLNVDHSDLVAKQVGLYNG
jgi:hypothetical protein